MKKEKYKKPYRTKMNLNLFENTHINRYIHTRTHTQISMSYKNDPSYTFHTVAKREQNANIFVARNLSHDSKTYFHCE